MGLIHLSAIIQVRYGSIHKMSILCLAEKLHKNTAFHMIRTTRASIFCLQDNHQHKLNHSPVQLCSKTKKDVWDNQGCPCSIETSLTVKGANNKIKYGGTMAGVSRWLLNYISKNIMAYLDNEIE